MKKKLLVKIFLASFIANIFGMHVEQGENPLANHKNNQRNKSNPEKNLLKELEEIQNQPRHDPLVLSRELLNQKNIREEIFNLFAITLLGSLINIDLLLPLLPINIDYQSLPPIEAIRENRLTYNALTIAILLFGYHLYKILAPENSIYYRIIYNFLQENIEEMKQAEERLKKASNIFDANTQTKEELSRFVDIEISENMVIKFYIIDKILKKEEDIATSIFFSPKELKKLLKIIDNEYTEIYEVIKNRKNSPDWFEKQQHVAHTRIDNHKFTTQTLLYYIDSKKDIECIKRPDRIIQKKPWLSRGTGEQPISVS